MKQLPSPTSEFELLNRAYDLTGKTIQQLAAASHQTLPASLHAAKGFMGSLLELLLGTTAGNKALPDFSELGIELKTLPIDFLGKPIESTYVTMLPLCSFNDQAFEKSEVYLKLRRVLWIPIVGDKKLDLASRYVATPFLWSPTSADWAILKEDWEEIMDMVHLGQIHSLSGRFGQYLHIRPKAASSRVLTNAYGESGELVQTLPRGFYLRVSFTKKILTNCFKINFL